MRPLRLAGLACLGLFLLSLGFLLFFNGFFPSSPRAPVWAAPPAPGGRPFQRLVVLLVDGLPSEMVLGRRDGREGCHLCGIPLGEGLGMPFLVELLCAGQGVGFRTRAAAPTVTLPRIKALVGGVLPGLRDLVANFAAGPEEGDSLLEQAHRLGWTTVVHGDNTWGRAFPHVLHPRSDAVSSLFVHDTVEVDANVTRHVASEGARRDWRVLVLHYLGLDHAGHVGGRGSPRVAAKLAEMDVVLRDLHERMVVAERGGGRDALKTLLLVVSDHGMTSEGNHGGAEPEETDAVAVFLGDFPRGDPAGAEGGAGASCAKGWGGAREGNQVDVAPTLAALLGLPVPAGSVGRALLPALRALLPAERLRALEANAAQLAALLAEEGRAGGEGEHLAALHRLARREHERWRAWARGGEAEPHLAAAGADNVATVYDAFLAEAARHLQGRSDRAWGRVWAGLACTAAGAGLLTAAAWRAAATVPPAAARRWALDSWVLAAGGGLTMVALVSSSLVEEEHYTCHFLLATFLAATARRLLAGGAEGRGGGGDEGALGLVAASAASARAVRWWHAGGVKWRHLPSISARLASGPAWAIPTVHGLAAAAVLAIAVRGGRGMRREPRGWLACLLGPALLAGCLYHRAVDPAAAAPAPALRPVALARGALAALGLAVLGPLLAPALVRTAGGCPRPLHSGVSGEGRAAARHEVSWAAGACWAALQLMLQPRASAGAVAGVYALSAALPPALERAGLPPSARAAAAWLGGWAGFFALGGSNRLATVALGGAHVGLEGDGVCLPALLAVAANYMGPLLASLLAAGRSPGPPLSALMPMAHGGVALAACSAILPGMRSHLFLGSVFAPKYLYCAAAAGVAALGTAAQLAVAALAELCARAEGAFLL